jgi:hypothetical protein
LSFSYSDDDSEDEICDKLNCNNTICFDNYGVNNSALKICCTKCNKNIMYLHFCLLEKMIIFKNIFFLFSETTENYFLSTINGLNSGN